jgi:hypothetical protein
MPVHVHVFATSDSFRVIRDILNEGGVRQLYRGFGTTLLRSIPSSAVLFGSYQYFFDFFSKQTKTW